MILHYQKETKDILIDGESDGLDTEGEGYDYEVAPNADDIADYIGCDAQTVDDLSTYGFLDWGAIEIDPDFVDYMTDKYREEAMSAQGGGER